MTTLADVAVDLGLPVFPCGADKAPLVAGGFKAATTDPRLIRAMFDRVEAVNIGVPTGAPSSWVAIDVDVKNGAQGDAWLQANAHRLPSTRTHATRSGGLHLVFRMPQGVEIRNSASRVAPGVDVRASGGFVIVPPSPGYSVADKCEPAEMPEWLIGACCRPEPKPAPVLPERSHDERRSKYAQAALDGEYLAVSRAAEGQRNHQLNNSAVKLGGLIASGALSRAAVESELTRAAHAVGLDAKETAATIASGLRHGMSTPREMPERKPEPVFQRAEALSSTFDPETGEIVAPIASHKPALWSVSDAWDEASIPVRPWVVRGYMMRGAVTVVSGPGSAGKSSLMVAWCCALGLGKDFHRFKPGQRFKVATYNVEDDEQEQKRRFSATLRQFGATPHTLKGHVAILGPTNIGTLVQLDPEGRILVATQVMQELEAYLAEFRPDVLILDPFVELHGAEENDNTAIRGVLAWFRSLASRYQMAVVILHHARKGGNSPGDPDSMRGASAIVGAARVALTLNVMTDEDADRYGVKADERRDYFRLDGAKSNYAKVDHAEWFERVEVQIENGSDGVAPDGVAAAVPWEPPGISPTTPSVLQTLLGGVARGSNGVPWSPKLSGEPRSIRHLLAAHNILGTMAENAAMNALTQAGMVTASFRHQGNSVKGLRTADGLPEVKWTEG